MTKNKLKRIIIISGAAFITLIFLTLTLLIQKDGVIVGDIGTILALSDVVSIIVFIIYTNVIIEFFYKD
jgi:hypothetical protein